MKAKKIYRYTLIFKEETDGFCPREIKLEKEFINVGATNDNLKIARKETMARLFAFLEQELEGEA